MKKRIFTFVLISFAAFLLLSCSSKINTDMLYSVQQENDSKENYEYAKDEEKAPAEGLTSSSGTALNFADIKRKVIYTTEISVETKEYDKSIDTLNKLIEKYSAYIESSDVNNHGFDRYMTRHATYVVRIPKDNYKSFVGESGTIGAVTRSMDRNTDITEQYIDTEARLETLKVLEERLLTLLSKSVELKDILELETKLSDTRYEIENLTGSLRKYDSLISYSTATINIDEVEVLTQSSILPKSFGEKISDSLNNSLESIKNGLSSFTIGLVYALPILITVCLPILIIVLVVVYAVKRRKQKANKIADEKNEKSE